MQMYFIWFAMFAGVQAVLTLVQFLLRKKQVKTVFRVLIIIAKVLVAVACSVLVMAGPVFFRPVQPLMVIIYAVLFMDAFADMIYTVYIAIRKKERKFVPAKVLSLILGILFFVYGTVNMQIVTPSYHTYTSTKLDKSYKIVFVADLHVGSSQNFSTTEKTIASIQAQKPDFVILGGDITDDYTTKEEMEETYRLFGEIGAPVYYVFGNHKVYERRVTLYRRRIGEYDATKRHYRVGRCLCRPRTGFALTRQRRCSGKR